jgi:uncharacterized protein YdaU (DUF1376 family)
MAKPDTYMPLVIGDYLKDTMHLGATEHGAYLLLLMHYWTNGALVDNPRQLAAICRCDAQTWADIRPTLAEFFEISDGFWKHGRVEKELLRAKGLQERAIAGGRGLSAKRVLKPSQTSAKRVLKSSPATATAYKDNGGNFEGSGSDGNGTVSVDWQDRLNRHKRGGYWPSTYGNRPDSPGPWDAPKALVLAWRAQHGIEDRSAA